MAEYNNNIKALFNEAIPAVTRLSELQKEINQVRVNPLAFNLEKNIYNYRIWYANVCSLLSEVNAKLDEDETIELETLRKLINRRLVYFPPHKTIINEGLNRQETKLIFTNWEKLEELLIIFEKYVRLYLDKHGLSNPDSEGDSLF